MSQIHYCAEKGYTAGAETYAKGRPDYPPEITEWLSSAMGLGHDKRVLDLGAGTGKFLRSLRRRALK